MYDPTDFFVCSGGGFFGYRLEDYGIVLEIAVNGSMYIYNISENGTATNLTRVVPDFDPRARPWYLGAAARGGAFIRYHC